MDTRHSNAGRPENLARNEYSTENLDLAAWLVCQGFSLHRLHPPPTSAQRQLTRFVFPRTDELHSAISAWESGQPVLGTDLRRYITIKKDLYSRARRVVAREGASR